MITLEPVEYKHLSILKKWRNEPDVRDFCRQPYLLSDVIQEEWFKSITKTRDMIAFIVCDKALGNGKEWVGYAALSNIDHIGGKAEVSYFTSPEWRGKGYGESAIFQLCYYAFYDLGLQKVYSDTFDYNMPEIKLNLNAGFAQSGVNPRHYFKRGQYIGSVSMYMLREMFDERYKEQLKLVKYAESKPL